MPRLTMGRNIFIGNLLRRWFNCTLTVTHRGLPGARGGSCWLLGWGSFPRPCGSTREPGCAERTPEDQPGVRKGLPEGRAPGPEGSCHALPAALRGCCRHHPSFRGLAEESGCCWGCSREPVSPSVCLSVRLSSRLARQCDLPGKEMGSGPLLGAGERWFLSVPRVSPWLCWFGWAEQSTQLWVSLAGAASPSPPCAP